MDQITLGFTVNLNVSLQIGDVAFYKSASSGDIYKIGSILSIVGNDIVTEIEEITARPVEGDFIFFAKDSEINTSGIIGHWASVKMELSGSIKKELFSVGTEVFKSS